jgi:hypothetical protein
MIKAKELPSSIGQLKALQEFDLANYHNLHEAYPKNKKAHKKITLKNYVLVQLHAILHWTFFFTILMLSSNFNSLLFVNLAWC